MLNKESQAETKVDSEQMPIAGSSPALTTHPFNQRSNLIIASCEFCRWWGLKNKKMNIAIDALGKQYERLPDEQYIKMLEAIGVTDKEKQKAVLTSPYDPQDMIKTIESLGMQNYRKVGPGELKPLKETKMNPLREVLTRAKVAYKEFSSFSKDEKQNFKLSPEQEKRLEEWKTAFKNMGVTAEQAAKSLKKTIPIILLLLLCSCYRPQVVKTVVVAERITKNGSYQVVCSDGLDNYVLSPFNRIPLGQRVDMDRSTHTFKIVSDVNGAVKIGVQ